MRYSVSKGDSQDSGNPICNSASNTTSPLVLLQSSEFGSQVSQIFHLVQHPGYIRYQAEARPRMVDSSQCQVEWEECASSSSGSNIGDRCLQIRMGNYMQRIQDRGSLDPTRERATYQSAGASNMILCSKIIHEGQDQYTQASMHGQPNSSVLCKQDGGTHSLLLMQEAWKWCLRRGSHSQQSTCQAWRTQ